MLVKENDLLVGGTDINETMYFKKSIISRFVSNHSIGKWSVMVKKSWVLKGETYSFI